MELKTCKIGYEKAKGGDSLRPTRDVCQGETYL